MSGPLRQRPIMGIYEKPFWDFVQQKELRLQTCLECGSVRYPPGPVCPQCASARSEWRPVQGHGRLLAWTVFHRKYFPDLPVPYAVGSVQLAEGPLLIANLINWPAVTPALDMPAKLVFEEAESAKIGKWWIYQWELVPDGAPAATPAA